LSLQVKITNNEVELVRDIKHYYAESLQVFRDFGGPSVYFHTQAIEEQHRDFMSARHIEMIYATLASWGMHRMGDPEDTKAKMVEYVDFERSLSSQRDFLSRYRDLRMDGCKEGEYRNCINELMGAYETLKVSISNATIVAHSKVLAHILPDLVPPIDRQYTVRFFTQDNKDFFIKSGKYKSVNLPTTPKRQFSDFSDYCVRIKKMFDQCDRGIFEINTSFNTSYPKVMDNVIMAFVKSVPKPKDH
jgi:hypothetical protein